MISFRYHVVSIVAVLLALAVGIALGSGPLRGEVDNSLVQQVQRDRERKAQLNARIAELETANGFTDAFATSLAPRLLGEQLSGSAVSVVLLPGAADATASAVGDLVSTAGGSVAGTYRIAPALLDTGQKQLVEELGSQLAESSEVSLPDDATSYARLGTLIGRAIATKGEPSPIDAAGAGILSGLSTADLMTPQGDPAQRGDLVLVVGGPGEAASPEAKGSGAVLSALVTAIDAAADGVVVAGPTSAAAKAGAISAVLEDVSAAQAVSTVDSLELATAQVVTVLALAQQGAGQTGHYGAVDAADGALPAPAGS